MAYFGGRFMSATCSMPFATAGLTFRIKIAKRLLTGSFPWNEHVSGGRERAIAWDRLSRLHSLSARGVRFSFDLAMRALRTVAPEWTTRAGEEAADSHAPVASWVETARA